MDSIRRAHRRAGVPLIAAAAAVLACETPSGPTPLPAPSLEAVEYRVSGVITDENGRTVANVAISLTHDPGANGVHKTTSGGDGTYEFRFSQPSSPPSVIAAYAQEGGSSIRPLDWAGQNTIIKDLRLRRYPAQRAGESVTITFGPESSLCNWEFGSSATTLCEWFRVTADKEGRLTVDVTPVDPGGVAVAGPPEGGHYVGSSG